MLQDSKFNLNLNTNTQNDKIQTQSQGNTKVSRYFAISSQYPKNSSQYCTTMVCPIVIVESVGVSVWTGLPWDPLLVSFHPPQL